MFKSLVFALLLLTSLSAHALDELSVISAEDQKVMNSIVNELGLKI